MSERVYVMLNKPRGYVTTASDEQGRKTVYTLLQSGNVPGMELPWLAPVGRLDKASEGLLLFSNDSVWAAQPDRSRIACRQDLSRAHRRVARMRICCARLRSGMEEGGEHLRAKAVRELRRGEKNAWLEIVLDEGRNRQIRRLLAAFDIEVLRLVRVAIGSLELGDLAKGQWRVLSAEEVAGLGSARWMMISTARHEGCFVCWEHTSRNTLA